MRPELLDEEFAVLGVHVAKDDARARLEQQADRRRSDAIGASCAQRSVCMTAAVGRTVATGHIHTCHDHHLAPEAGERFLRRCESRHLVGVAEGRRGEKAFMAGGLGHGVLIVSECHGRTRGHCLHCPAISLGSRPRNGGVCQEEVSALRLVASCGVIRCRWVGLKLEGDRRASRQQAQELAGARLGSETLPDEA